MMTVTRSDTTYLRNKVTDTVYVDGTPYVLKKKDE